MTKRTFSSFSFFFFMQEKRKKKTSFHSFLYQPLRLFRPGFFLVLHVRSPRHCAKVWALYRHRAFLSKNNTLAIWHLAQNHRKGTCIQTLTPDFKRIRFLVGGLYTYRTYYFYCLKSTNKSSNVYVYNTYENKNIRPTCLSFSLETCFVTR